MDAHELLQAVDIIGMTRRIAASEGRRRYGRLTVAEQEDLQGYLLQRAVTHAQAFDASRRQQLDQDPMEFAEAYFVQRAKWAVRDWARTIGGPGDLRKEGGRAKREAAVYELDEARDKADVVDVEGEVMARAIVAEIGRYAGALPALRQQVLADALQGRYVHQGRQGAKDQAMRSELSHLREHLVRTGWVDAPVSATKED